MRRRLSVLLIFCILSNLLMFSGCGKSFTGPYAAQLEAASRLSSLKNDDKSQMVTFYESYNRKDYLPLEDCPALVLTIKNINKVDEVVERVKEEFAGIDVPWLVVEDFEDLVLDDLKDNDFASLGIVITKCTSSEITFHYSPPIDEIDNLTRLGPARIPDDDAADYDILPDVEELILCNELFWLDKCPNVEKLNIVADSGSVLEILIDPSKVICIPSLNEITVDESSLGKAVAYALFMDNPQIVTINGENADSFDFTGGLEGAGLDRFNQAVLRYKADRIDLSGFTQISSDDAVLHGAVTVVGYDGAEEASQYNSLSRYLTEEELSHISQSGDLGDTVIRLTTEEQVDGGYSDGRASYELSVYMEVIDLQSRTVTERTRIQRNSGSAVISNGTGSRRGQFSVERFCATLSELMARSY
ncbi:MAG: hypothetical protein IKE53_04390 [Clostridiales bacterium]|nr:hypothetical protein [Clostridiales bacterium]